MLKALEPPIVVKFADGESVTLSSWNSLGSWLDQTFIAWSDYQKHLKRPPVGNVFSGFDQALNELSQAKTCYQTVPHSRDEDTQLPDTKLEEIRSYLNSFSAFSLPDINGSFGILLSEVVKVDSLTSWMALTFGSTKLLPDNFYQNIANHPQWARTFFSHYVAGLALAVHARHSGPNRVKSEVAALKRLKKAAEAQNEAAHNLIHECDENLASLKSKVKNYETFVESEKTRLLDFWNQSTNRVRKASAYLIKRSTRRLQQIREFYRTELALQEPVRYWATKSTSHKNAARFWAVIFVVSTIVLGSLLVWNFKDLSSAILEASAGKEFPLGVLTIVLTPAFLALWLLRIVSRQMHLNVASMHDARDREVMAKTFLALLEHGKVNADDRVLILHALFRPAPSGGSEDNAPPHWFDMLMDRMKPRSGAGSS